MEAQFNLSTEKSNSTRTTQKMLSEARIKNFCTGHRDIDYQSPKMIICVKSEDKSLAELICKENPNYLYTEPLDSETKNNCRVDGDYTSFVFSVSN